VAEEIDEEVKELIGMAYRRAEEILVTHKPKLVRLSEYLIEHETVTGAQLNTIIGDDELGGEPGTGTPAVPPPPPSYTPTPHQPTVPQPAPTMSSHTDPSPAVAPGDPEA
jgi:cell division protease FtsH